MTSEMTGLEAGEQDAKASMMRFLENSERLTGKEAQEEIERMDAEGFVWFLIP